MSQHLHSSTEKLLKILKGEVENVSLDTKTIISSKKMRNVILRKFVETYRTDTKFPDKVILQILLALDEAIEKEYLTEELLEYMKANPDKIQELLKQK